MLALSNFLSSIITLLETEISTVGSFAMLPEGINTELSGGDLDSISEEERTRKFDPPTRI